MPAGDVRGGHLEELFNGSSFDRALAELRADYDVVIFDAPSESDGEAARIAASGCDATLLIVRGQGTDRRRAEASRDRLLDVGANVGGMIVNHAAGHRLEQTRFGGENGKIALAASA
jgi:Mrp family chromosome partitioning ATPase